MIKVRAHVALTLASAMSALALVHSTAFAQATPADATESATSGDALQEVVVTAEFRTEKLQEIPLAVTAVNAETMEQLRLRLETYLNEATRRAYAQVGRPEEASHG